MYSDDTQRDFIRTIVRAKSLLFEEYPVRMKLFGKELQLRIDQDKKFIGDMGDAGDGTEAGRPFIQIRGYMPCNDTEEPELQSGRKYYLSPHQTDDEIVKTAFEAYKAFVNHEMMEGFTIGGTRFVDPHTDFREILKANSQGRKRSR